MIDTTNIYSDKKKEGWKENSHTGERHVCLKNLGGGWLIKKKCKITKLKEIKRIYLNNIQWNIAHYNKKLHNRTITLFF